MPFKSEKQRKWMHTNDPEMAKKWEKKEKKMKREQRVKELIRKMVREIMNEDFAGAYPKSMRKKFDGKRRKQSEVLGYKLTGKDDVKTEIDDATIKEGKLTELQKKHKDFFLMSMHKDIVSLKGQIAYAKDKVNYKGTPDWEKKEFKAVLKDLLKDLKDMIARQKRVKKWEVDEGKLSEGFKKIALKNVKYKDKEGGTYTWEIKSGIDTDVMGGNTPKIILHYTHEDEEGYPMSGGNTFWLKHKNGKPYTPQEAKKLVNKISNKKIHDFQRKSTKPSGSGQNIYYVDGKFIREGKLTEVKFKKVILPNDMKTKVKVSKMIKQLKLKIDKDYDVKALKARGGDQVISILPKHYNKFIELAMQNKLNPRG